jgi:hypothetical protein
MMHNFLQHILSVKKSLSLGPLVLSKAGGEAESPSIGMEAEIGT